MRHLPAAAVLLLATACVTGTSGVTSSTSSSSSGAGGSSSAAPFVNDWSCVPRTAAAPASTQETFTFEAWDGVGGYLAGVTFKVCLNADLDCATPTATGVTGADGRVELELPLGTQGYRGHVRTSGGGRPDQIAMLPLFTAGTLVTIRVWSQSDMDTYLAPLGVQLDAMRGVVAWGLRDCQQSSADHASGQLSTSDAQTVRAHDVNGSPRASAMETNVGSGLFVNAPAGAATLTVVDNTGGQDVLVGPVVVRPGMWTYLYSEHGDPR